MLKNYLKFAFRNLRKNKSFSLINIFGFAFGMSICLGICAYLLHEYSYNHYHKNVERIYRLNDAQNNTSTIDYRVKDILLTNYPEIDGDIRLVYIFTAIAIFILIIACINYMNMTTALFNRRAKEVGLRKVVGAQKGALVGQFFSESLTLSILAIFIAVLLVHLALPFFNNLTQKNVALFTGKNNGVYIGVTGLTVLVGLLAGSYPAFFLSSFQPVIVLRGALKASTKSPLRTALVVTQFTIAIILITCTLVVYQQHNYLIHKKLGYNQNHIIYLPINKDILQKYDAFKDKLLQHTEIRNVTVASSFPHRIGNTNPVDWEGKSADDMVLTKFAVVDPDYVKTFEMEIAEGRNFSKQIPTDISNFIINRKAAELMKLDQPLDKQLDFMNIKGRIIGVLDDFHNRPLDQEINPLVLLINPSHYDYFLQSVFIKMNTADIPATIKTVEKIYREFASNYPFEFDFLDAAVERTYRTVQRMAQLFQYFAFLAIFISCLGLFALSLFMAEQRTKEIGVRKSLGATVPNIALLFSKEFTRWLLLSTLIAWPIALFFMSRWLQTFVYRIKLTVWPFILAGAIAIFIALVTVSQQALRAALANPVKSLRYE